MEKQNEKTTGFHFVVYHILVICFSVDIFFYLLPFSFAIINDSAMSNTMQVFVKI